MLCLQKSCVYYISYLHFNCRACPARCGRCGQRDALEMTMVRYVAGCAAHAGCWLVLSSTHSSRQRRDACRARTSRTCDGARGVTRRKQTTAGQQLRDAAALPPKAEQVEQPEQRGEVRQRRAVVREKGLSRHRRRWRNPRSRRRRPRPVARGEGHGAASQ